MSEQPTSSRIIKTPSYADAIIPVVVLIVLVAGAVYLFGLDAADGPMQVALIFSSMVVALILLKNGHTWEEISKSSGSALASVSTPFFILFSVGALIGTWNMSGTIPTMVFYGIQLLHPSYFYVAAFLICVVISIGIGSSWTTAGTMGVGLVGLATMVGVSPVITAGAVVSGSYVGDKLSPLSETTVLTAELAGINVLTHIRAMLWSSGPAAIIALVVFAILSLREGGVVHNVDTASELAKLDQLFWITPLNLLPLLFFGDPLVSESAGVAGNPCLSAVRGSHGRDSATPGHGTHGQRFEVLGAARICPSRLAGDSKWLPFDFRRPGNRQPSVTWRHAQHVAHTVDHYRRRGLRHAAGRIQPAGETN
jgi:NhaC family Na+:H+ antiporter